MQLSCSPAAAFFLYDFETHEPLKIIPISSVFPAQTMIRSPRNVSPSPVLLSIWHKDTIAAEINPLKAGRITESLSKKFLFLIVRLWEEKMHHGIDLIRISQKTEETFLNI